VGCVGITSPSILVQPYLKSSSHLQVPVSLPLWTHPVTHRIRDWDGMASEQILTRWRKAILLPPPKNDVCHPYHILAALIELSNRFCAEQTESIGLMTSIVKRKGSNKLFAKALHKNCVFVTDVQFCEEF
jgi:hypothetical protein